MKKHRLFSKSISILLCALMLMSAWVFVAPQKAAAADEWNGNLDSSGFSNNHITSAGGLAQFLRNISNNTNYSGQTIYLDVDIDLKNIDMGSGDKDIWNNRGRSFQGTFDGQNHTISNFKMTDDDHRVGLFRYADGASFKNLTMTNVSVDRNKNASKNGYAALVGYGNNNSLTFENIYISISYIWGVNYCGGIVGEYDSDNTIKMTNCSVSGGSITANSAYAGGLVGKTKGVIDFTDCHNYETSITSNSGDAGGLVGYIDDDVSIFTNCSNSGVLKGSSVAGGILGWFNGDRAVTIDNCTNNGAINASSNYAGGIIGGTNGNAYVYNCSNNAAVTSNGNHAGGIVGYIQDDTSEIKKCTNGGDVTSTGYTGGILSIISWKLTTHNPITLTDNINTGRIYSSGSGKAAGGIAGRIETNATHTVSNNINRGEIIAYEDAGGIFGSISGSCSIKENINFGSVTAQNDNAGGILGEFQRANGTSSYSLTFTDCYNSASVQGKNSVGGILGYGQDMTHYFENCGNCGEITSSNSFAGGIYGYGNSGSGTSFTQCWNVGDVIAASDAGGICGKNQNHALFYRCWNGGAIGSDTQMDNTGRGGIVGFVGDYGSSSSSNPCMTDCYNWGVVKGGRDMGGLVGKSNNGGTYYITNSYNTGEVREAVASRNAIMGWGGNVSDGVYYASDVSMGGGQGTAKTLAEFIDYGNFTLSSSFCKNTWGVKIGGNGPTYYYPILTWYRDLFTFDSHFKDDSTGTDIKVDNVAFNNGIAVPEVPSKADFHHDGKWHKSDDTNKTLSPGSVTAGVTNPLDTYVITQSKSDVQDIRNQTVYIIMFEACDYAINVAYLAPTYTINGSRTDRCTVCGSDKVKTINSLNNFLIVEPEYHTAAKVGKSETFSIAQKATNDGVSYSVVGIMSVGAVENDDAVPAADPGANNEVGGNQGTLKFSGGKLEYTLNDTLSFSGADSFYLILAADGVGSKGYSTDRVYTFEKMSFVPAKELFFEDNNAAFKYTDSANATSEYGQWKFVKRNASVNEVVDTADDVSYTDGDSLFYSAGAARTVKVSNTIGSEWPKMTFTFTGTGFDLVSVTDNESGVFVVTATNGSETKRKIVNTYYGYEYVDLFYDTETKKIVKSGGVPLYEAQEDTTEGVIYNESGSKGYIIEQPTGAKQAKGWLKADGTDTNTLYQIPVLAMHNLNFGTWKVTIEARFTSMFETYLEAADGSKYYNLTVDGIRIYDPAGGSNDAKKVYRALGEEVVKYTLLRDAAASGSLICLDGLEKVDVETAKANLKAMPNNEIYVQPNGSVSFDINGGFNSVQIGMKSVGSEDCTVSISGEKSDITVSSAGEKYYPISTHFGTVTITNKGSGTLSLTYLRTAEDDTTVSPDASVDGTNSVLSVGQMTLMRAKAFIASTNETISDASADAAQIESEQPETGSDAQAETAKNDSEFSFSKLLNDIVELILRIVGLFR